MRKRTAHRWRLATVFAIGTVFALGSFWLVEVMRSGEDEVQADARKNEPDYIVENFSFVRMTAAGAPHYIVSGTKLTHRPIDDSSEIVAPVMQGIAEDQPPMTIHARTAHVDHTGNRVTLNGSVDIERAEAPGVQRMSLKTESLTVLADDDQMETDQPVNMVLGDSTISAVGMHANNATRQVHLASKSKIVTPPKPGR